MLKQGDFKTNIMSYFILTEMMIAIFQDYIKKNSK